MATEAARLERKESTGRKKEKHLTHTGLLMEGTLSIDWRHQRTLGGSAEDGI
jgi:hypothetical protein